MGKELGLKSPVERVSNGQIWQNSSIKIKIMGKIKFIMWDYSNKIEIEKDRKKRIGKERMWRRGEREKAGE